MFVLNAADGCIPSDLATGTPAEIEEERRLLYVAMTRAKNALTLVHPLRFFIRQQQPLRRPPRLHAAHALHPRRDPRSIRARRPADAADADGPPRSRRRAPAHRRRRPPARDLGRRNRAATRPLSA